jgi:hypothetical protein
MMIIMLMLITVGKISIIGGSAKISFDDAVQLANNTASKYGVFLHQTTWYVHVNSNGIIQAANNLNHKIDESSTFSCSFSINPNDAKDHFAFLSVFRSSNAGYAIALDDQNGQVIDSKPVPYQFSVCGP